MPRLKAGVRYRFADREGYVLITEVSAVGIATGTVFTKRASNGHRRLSKWSWVASTGKALLYAAGSMRFKPPRSDDWYARRGINTPFEAKPRECTKNPKMNIAGRYVGKRAEGDTPELLKRFVLKDIIAKIKSAS